MTGTRRTRLGGSLWSKGEKLKLNLGCGLDYRPDYLNVEFNPRIKADFYCDASRLPFKSDSIEGICAHHLLEHFDSTVEVLREWHRVLKKGAELELIVPYAFSNYGFVDVTHRKYFTWNSLEYFDKDSYQGYNYDFHFKLTERKFVIIGGGKFKPVLNAFAGLASRFPELFERFFKGFVQMDAIQLKMVKV